MGMGITSKGWIIYHYNAFIYFFIHSSTSVIFFSWDVINSTIEHKSADIFLR